MWYLLKTIELEETKISFFRCQPSERWQTSQASAHLVETHSFYHFVFVRPPRERYNIILCSSENGRDPSDEKPSSLKCTQLLKLK